MQDSFPLRQFSEAPAISSCRYAVVGLGDCIRAGRTGLGPTTQRGARVMNFVRRYAMSVLKSERCQV